VLFAKSEGSEAELKERETKIGKQNRKQESEIEIGRERERERELS
jgi:hypothetical protein